MHLAILSRSPECYSTRRLIEAIKSKGHEVDILDVIKFSIEMEEGEPGLYYKGKPIQEYDAVIPRIGASVTRYGTSVLRQFEQMDIYTPNTSSGIGNSRDKLRSLQIFSRHDVGIPRTAYVHSAKDAVGAIDRVGGTPVIIKLIEGTQGVGVILADKKEIAMAIIETLHSADLKFLIQKFVAESKGKDVRAFVIGDRVVGAMRRTAQGQEFRSNVHRGGLAESIKLEPAYEEAAIRAAQIMGLKICGVDMLEGKDGPQIMEVNSSPGFEGIEGATGLDIAGEAIDYIIDQVNLPEIDLRQRLTVSRGYGVADIIIPEGSSFVGKTIEEMGLLDDNFMVLSLRRDGKVISIPKKSRSLEGNDILLCYGKMSFMKNLIHDKPRKKRKVSQLPVTPVTETNSLTED